MKTEKTSDFIVTDGYLIVMENKRIKEEKQKFIWDVEDESYYFEEKY